MHINDNLSVFFFQMNLMKNKLELVRLVFQKIYDITSQMENAHKKACCIFETMFTMH